LKAAAIPANLVDVANAFNKKVSPTLQLPLIPLNLEGNQGVPFYLFLLHNSGGGTFVPSS